MFVDVGMVAAGLVLLVIGGELLVRGAVSMSLRLGVSPLVVGLTVVAFGTSAPELVTSVSAALNNNPDIAIGNVVGSNTANVLVILGVAAMIAPIYPSESGLLLNWKMLMAALVLLIGLCFVGPLGLWHGLVLLAAMAATMVVQILQAKRDGTGADTKNSEGGPGWPRIILRIAVGLTLLPIGAQLLVTGAVDIATALGVSDVVIGLTLVAVGTSLPELAATVSAALKGRADIALGNVVGSNIFNALAILGITALIRPLPIPPQMLSFDLWVMLATSALLGWFIWKRQAIGRMVGAGLVGIYGIYAAALVAMG